VNHREDYYAEGWNNPLDIV